MQHRFNSTRTVAFRQDFHLAFSLFNLNFMAVLSHVLMPRWAQQIFTNQAQRGGWITLLPKQAFKHNSIYMLLIE